MKKLILILLASFIGNANAANCFVYDATRDDSGQVLAQAVVEDSTVFIKTPEGWVAANFPLDEDFILSLDIRNLNGASVFGASLEDDGKSIVLYQGSINTAHIFAERSIVEIDLVTISSLNKANPSNLVYPREGASISCL